MLLQSQYRDVVHSSISMSGVGYAQSPGTDNEHKIGEIEQDAIHKSLLIKQTGN